MSFSKKKLLVVIIILIFLCLWLYSAFFNATQEKYITLSPKRGNIEVSVLATGILKPLRLVAVGARTTGRIISLNASSGSRVKQGDLLAEIDPTTQKNDLKNKEAALVLNTSRLDEQEAQLFLAKKNLKRQKAMIKSNAVSQSDLENAEAEVKIRLAQVNASKAQIIQSEVDVENARVNLGYTRITAPFDGTVLATVVQEGQNVNAVQSAPTIIILGDLSVMTIHAEISEADIIKVNPGQELYFTVIGNPDRRYKAKLARIEPAPSSIRNDISFNSNVSTSTSSATAAIYYNGIFDIDNADGTLHTYMTAEVHIILGRSKNALLIPADAIMAPDNDDSYTVTILQSDGKIIERKVKVGLNDKVMVEILSGLDEHDNVVIGSNHDINIISNYKHHTRSW